MFAMTLMGFSCERDDDGDVNTATEITVNDLLGDWHFQSLTFNGVVYDTEEELAELDKTYSYIQLSFLNITPTTIGFFCHRSGIDSPAIGEYILSNNNINFEEGKFVFNIENWKTFNGTMLKVKLISSNATNEAPIGGIFTMVR